MNNNLKTPIISRKILFFARTLPKAESGLGSDINRSTIPPESSTPANRPGLISSSNEEGDKVRVQIKLLYFQIKVNFE